MLRDLGYKFNVPSGWNENSYRLYACLMLEMHDLLPSHAGPISIDNLKSLFYEEFFQEVRYVPGLLSSNGIWGMTISKTNSSPEIFLDSSLLNTDSPGMLRRHKTTLAHEIGHALLHSSSVSYRAAAYSKNLLPQVSLESGKKFDLEEVWFRQHNYSNGVDFREFQANQIMVSLLMPFNLVIPSIAQLVQLKLDWLYKHDGYNQREAIEIRLWEIIGWVVNQTSRCYDLSRELVTIEVKRLLTAKHGDLILKGYGDLPTPQHMSSM